MKQEIALIVAADDNNAIGLNGAMLTHLPNDLRYFKETTSNYPIIMGRRTFESLPKGALPNRRNIVISRNKDLKLKNAETYQSMNEALDQVKDESKVFIIGGGTIYKQSLDIANYMYITRIHHKFSEADTYFPEIDETKWKEAWSERHETDKQHKYAYTFIRYDKIGNQ